MHRIVLRTDADCRSWLASTHHLQRHASAAFTQCCALTEKLIAEGPWGQNGIGVGLVSCKKAVTKLLQQAPCITMCESFAGKKAQAIYPLSINHERICCLHFDLYG